MKKNNKNFYYTCTVIMLLTTFLFVACDEDDNNVLNDDTLSVLSKSIGVTDLKEDAENIPIDNSIVIIFSHSLTTEKVISSLALTSGAGVKDYSIEFSNTNSTVTLTPSTPFDYATTYTLSLAPGVYGTGGESLEEQLTLNFTTEAFILPTLVLTTSISEIDEEGGVAVITAELNKPSDEAITANLIFSGTAVENEDYTIEESKSITIPIGSLSVSINITAITDSFIEGDETIEIAAGNIVNAIYDPQELSITVKDKLAALSLKGIMALSWNESGANGGKAIHLVANEDITDLSIYGIGVANNGGGTDGKEYSFPMQSVTAGDDILVARDVALMTNYFGECISEFEYVITADSSINQNGDDAIELFINDAVIETFGDNAIDGTGQDWEYTESWAYKIDGVWSYGGLSCSVGSNNTQSSTCPYPICPEIVTEPAEPLILQGVLAMVWEGSGSNGGKAIHLKAGTDIADLSIYSLGIANNGGGTDGIEYTFPAISVAAGDDIIVGREPETLTTYFGSCIDSFEHVLVSNDAVAQNGDDAIELFNGETVIETYGDADVDGTGESWEYKGSWAYKMNGIWITGGLDCAAGSTTTQSSACIYPTCN